MSENTSSKFSVIMASRLLPYVNQAKYPDLKLHRAIKSVLTQSFTDFEFIIVADGCQQTVEIASEYKDPRLRIFEVKHKQLFDNLPRNTGIENAKGEFIIYCDADDYWGEDHLKIISEYCSSYDWVWYNDMVIDHRSGQWIERYCDVRKLGMCGTSNVCHRSRVKWGRPGYAHDFYFIQQLWANRNNSKIKTPEYFVCHIPNQYDV